MLDSKEIRELIDLISRSNFQTFELEGEGFRIKLVKEPVPAAAVPVVTTAPATPPVAVAAAVPAPAAAEGAPPESGVDNGLIDLNSPIVGTFFRAPGPDAEPFVEVGTRVVKGQVVCIVEAMKVMNEIESEIDAEVVEVAVANGQPVEYGEVLLRLRPLS